MAELKADPEVVAALGEDGIEASFDLGYHLKHVDTIFGRVFGGGVSLRAQAFGPAIDAGRAVLVLGSLPGAESLRRGEYYAHRQNAFWRLIGAVVGVDLAALPYPARLEALAAARVGLWDVVASAVRPGSGDAAIRDAVHADLAGLVAGLPELRAIGFNGATAARIGRRSLYGGRGAGADRPAVVEPGARGDTVRGEAGAMARALGLARGRTGLTENGCACVMPD